MTILIAEWRRFTINNYRWHFEAIKSKSEIRWWWRGLLFQLLFPSFAHWVEKFLFTVMKHKFMSMVCAGNKKYIMFVLQLDTCVYVFNLFEFISSHHQFLNDDKFPWDFQLFLQNSFVILIQLFSLPLLYNKSSESDVIYNFLDGQLEQVFSYKNTCKKNWFLLQASERANDESRNYYHWKLLSLRSALSYE